MQALKRFLKTLGAAAAFLVILALPSWADEKVDMSKMTCQDFMDLDEEETAYFYFWLDGYVSAKTNNMVLNPATVEGDLEALYKACKANPKIAILELVSQ
jgi:hypothetical protein